MVCAVVSLVVAAVVELQPPVGDAAETIQRALDETNNRVVKLGAGDWSVEKALYLSRSDLELVLSDGCRLLAKEGCFKDPNESLIFITKRSRKGERPHDITVRGEGKAVIEMRMTDYLNVSEYKRGDWRHGILVGQADRVKISGVTITRTGGDGIYINHAKDVAVEDSIFIDCFRLGAAVIDVEGLAIRRCKFIANNGTPPQGGIDFEPNHAGEQLCDIVMEDCVFEGHLASGLLMHLPQLNSTSKPVSMIFRRCISRNNKYDGFRVTATSDAGPVKGSVQFIDCVSQNNAGNDLTLNLVAKDGIQFKTCGCNFTKTETIAWTKPEGAAIWNARAIKPLVTTPRRRTSGWFRGGLTFVQPALEVGRTYRTRFISKKMGAHSERLKLSITDMAGTPLETKTFEEGFGPDGFLYTFKVESPNCRQFKIDGGNVLVQVETDDEGAAIRADHPVHVFGHAAPHTYSIKVPADATNVKIALQAEEPIRGVLFDANDEKVSEAYNTKPQSREYLSATRTPTAQDEVWHVVLTAKEDARFSIAAPCPPVAELR